MLLVRVSLSVVVLGYFYSGGYCNKSKVPVGLSNDSGVLHEERKGHESVFNAFFANPKTDGKLKSEAHHGIQSSNSSTNATSSGRQYYITGATGWGWPGYTSGNLDLYSLLGGLAFLGLLASLFLYFSNRTATTTVMMVNATGRRRRALHESEDEIAGESLSDFLSKLGLTFSTPWWDEVKSINKQKIVPFNLN